MDDRSRGTVHLFEVRLQFTGTVEYGYSFKESIAGVPIPPLGARFDVFFEGEITGTRLTGKLKGADYVRLGPDGVSRLHIHAHVTTNDGCHIALHSEGTARRRPGSSFADTEETMTFSTAAEPYLWLNSVRGIGVGAVDTTTGRVEMTVSEAY